MILIKMTETLRLFRRGQFFQKYFKFMIEFLGKRNLTNSLKATAEASGPKKLIFSSHFRAFLQPHHF